jgi:hypothetical protein
MQAQNVAEIVSRHEKLNRKSFLVPKRVVRQTPSQAHETNILQETT